MVPVVCDADDGFVAFVADERDLVFDFQHRLPVFHTRRVPHFALHRPRVAFLHVLTHVAKLNPLLAVPVYRLRPFEILLAPSLRSSMQAIGSVVGSESVGLAVQIVQRRVSNAVRRAADRLAEIGCVVRLVKGRFGESDDDVVACDVEFLDEGALGEEGEC